MAKRVGCLNSELAMNDSPDGPDFQSKPAKEFLDRIPEPSADLIAKIPAETARRWKVVPVNISFGNIDKTLVIAVSDPNDFETFDVLHHLLGPNVEFVAASEAEIQRILQQYYPEDP
jgi:Type II secretion system (T2SS), protein E, N-terminal domain